MYPHHHQERGAALIVSLLVLAVLTLLSLSAMNSATMQQRISGHLKDSQLAFEAADAALRDTESWLNTLSPPPTPCAGLAVSCEVFAPTTLNALDAANGAPWWTQADSAWWQTYGLDFLADGQDLLLHAADPYSVVEEVAREPDSLVVGVAPQGSRVYYRITAHGVGGTPTAQSVVQSTFVKHIN